jgi:hypothetical protein
VTAATYMRRSPAQRKVDGGRRTCAAADAAEHAAGPLELLARGDEQRGDGRDERHQQWRDDDLTHVRPPSSCVSMVPCSSYTR